MAMCLTCLAGAQTYILTHVAGTYGTVGYTGNGGPATAALMGGPWDVCTDSLGHVYVLDQGLAAVRRIDNSGIINLYAGTGTSGYSGNGGPATAANIRTHSGNIAADASGNLYICEHWNHTIRKIDPSGVITHVAGTNATSGFSGDGGVATAALLSHPSRIVTDRSGNIYFMDAGNNRVRRIDASGVITTVAGNGSNTPSPDGLAATATGIDSWSSLAVDNSGNLFIGLTNQKRILKVNTSGVATTYAGSTTAHPGPGPVLPFGGTGPAVDYPFWSIGDIAADKRGNLFVIDGAKICMVDSTGIIKKIAGATSVAGHSGSGGFAQNALINPSYGLDVAENGDIYFVELNNQTMHKLVFANYSPSFAEGSLTTIASCTPGSTFALDTILRVSDADSADTLVWSVTSAPANGTVSGTVTGGSNSSVVYPSGLSYTANAGFTGVDSFVVQVFDGLEYDSITVRATIVSPTSGIAGLSACMGAPAPLNYTASGGTWSVDNTSVATIDATTGILTPVSTGTTTVTYELYAGCTTTAVVTVNSAVSSITGASAICSGVPTSLSVTPTGGTWTSSDTTLATIDGAGVVTGVTDSLYVVSNREVTILYTAPTGCTASVVLTVNATPLISGSPYVCEETWSTLSTIHTSATWSSSNASVVSVDGSGNLFGAVAGTATISLTGDGGCVHSITVTVNPTPTITGTMSICEGSTTTLTATPSGGTWSTTDTTVATVDGSGLFTAVYNPAYGSESQTTYVSYVATTGCNTNRVLTVNALPVISGAGAFCNGVPSMLGLTWTGAGTWTSSDTTIAGVYGGYVTGVAPGTVLISYTSPSGCTDTATVTILESPTISSPSVICAGATYTFTATTSPGTWASYNPYAVGITSGGVASGVSAGVATIVYTDTNGCSANNTITVNAPSANYGVATLCSNDSTTLYNYEYGGTWSSADPSVALVNASTGVVYPVAAGTANITYTAPSTCRVVTQVTVMPAPPSISGPSVLCLNAIGSFAPMLTGIAGTWSTSDAGVLEVKPSSGGYQAGGVGTSTVAYTYGNGCYSSVVVTVITTPPTPTVTGSTTMTVGGTQTLTATPTGGTWSSNNTSRATVDATSGVVTAVSAGNVTILYTATNMCGSTSKGIRLTIAALRPAVTDADKEYVYNLYPNPATDVLNIDVPEEAAFCIYGIDGKAIMTGDLAKGINTFNLPFHLAPGIYACSIRSATGKTHTVRLQVARN